MKTVEELLNQEPVFLNAWTDRFDVIASFEDVYMTKEEYESVECPYVNEGYWSNTKRSMKEALDRYENVNILFASYGYENYEGSAWVLFEEGGVLYEVNGSHCSCYGLEGQWGKDPVVLVELKNRLEKGTFGLDSYSGNEFARELKTFLGI